MTLPVAIVTAVLSLLTIIGGGLWGFKRNNISGAKEVTESALLLIKPQHDRIAQLICSVDMMSSQVDALTSKIMRLERHVDVLTNQIVSMGATPAPLEEGS